jgi:hypothetical protein
VPLARLLALDRSQWAPDDYGPQTNLHYAEAASFVSFLIATRPGQKIFAEVYETSKAREDVGNALSADRVRALERDWHEEVKKRIASAAGPPR